MYALLMRASWPTLKCPKYGEHHFFADLGSFFCEGCGDEIEGMEEAISYNRWMVYVYYYGSGTIRETANLWN